uniref:Uncharacterized protein n=1 Tax=Onchocerca volvulus TaxID=6282 RepID=A0A8R1Y0A4_ONCVO
MLKKELLSRIDTINEASRCTDKREIHYTLEIHQNQCAVEFQENKRRSEISLQSATMLKFKLNIA